MPIVSIDAPAGLPAPGKKRLMHQINAALGEAYGMTENIIFLREYPRENVAIAGVLRSDSPAQPRAARKNRASPVSP
jgi:phenylpyruvate tautomerase PptA (4-oxalocrotonate tautomerase family)